MSHLCYSTEGKKSEYERIEAQYRSPHTRRCIDGSITGCGNCVGYCKFEQHPGFLTREQRMQHNCLNKGCHYYVAKSAQTSVPKPRDKGKELQEIASRLSADMDGFRITSVAQSAKGEWRIFYVTISHDQPLEQLLREIRALWEEQVFLQQLSCDFDQAVQLIYQI